MEHTYFVAGRRWTAVGIYRDDKNLEYTLTGEVKLEGDDTTRRLGGFLEVAFDSPVRFTNNYVIKLISPHEMEWESCNPDLGTLKGTFTIEGDYIMSLYVSDDGRVSGSEVLRMLDGDTYENVGVCRLDGKRLSSWSATISAL